MGNKAGKPPESPDLPTEDDYPSAREQMPVLWFRGRREVAPQWMTDALDMRSQQAPEDANGKK
jgi:hypothetical protein